MQSEDTDLLSIVLQCINTGITVQNKKGKFLYVNNMAAKMMGFSSEIQLMNSDPDKILQAYSLLDSKNKPFSLDNLPSRKTLKTNVSTDAVIQYIHKKTKEKKWSYVKAIPVRSSKGKLEYVVNTLVDITEEKQENQSVERFVATASHEFKTPLASVKALNQLSAKRLRKIGDKQLISFAAKIDEKINELTRLINDFLDTAKIRSGTLSLIAEPVEFDSFIQDIVDDMQRIYDSHLISVTGKTYKTIVADSGRLRQAIVNLIRNARKYSPNSKKIEINLLSSDDNVTISVRDFGIGIKKSDIKNIFTPYYRSDISKTQTGGLGLGLFITSHIVKAHGGNIVVNSRPNKGSVFSVILPIKSQKKLTIIDY